MTIFGLIATTWIALLPTLLIITLGIFIGVLIFAWSKVIKAYVTDNATSEFDTVKVFDGWLTPKGFLNKICCHINETDYLKLTIGVFISALGVLSWVALSVLLCPVSIPIVTVMYACKCVRYVFRTKTYLDKHVHNKESGKTEYKSYD